MRKSAYQQMLDGLSGITAPEDAKRQFEELIRRSAALNGVASLDRQERVQFARHLLDQQASRPVIRDRLMAKYELGRSQAYEVIDQALQLSGF